MILPRGPTLHTFTKKGVPCICLRFIRYVGIIYLVTLANEAAFSARFPMMILLLTYWFFEFKFIADIEIQSKGRHMLVIALLSVLLYKCLSYTSKASKSLKLLEKMNQQFQELQNQIGDLRNNIDSDYIPSQRELETTSDNYSDYSDGDYFENSSAYSSDISSTEVRCVQDDSVEMFWDGGRVMQNRKNALL